MIVVVAGTTGVATGGTTTVLPPPLGALTVGPLPPPAQRLLVGVSVTVLLTPTREKVSAAVEGVHSCEVRYVPSS